MLRTIVTLTILFSYSHIQIQGVTIEFPQSDHIKNRTRPDIHSVDPIFRHYIVPREIQFNASALQGSLSFFLKCKGSKNAVQFTIPPSASNYLSLNNDSNSPTITATLRQKTLDLKLIGRYTCSETIDQKKSETSVYVFIVDDKTVFTKRTYPTVSRGTGIHFFNIPCQATSWYARISCPDVSDSERCSVRKCSPAERRANELKCNLPQCEGEDICIPVYYIPGDFEASKTFFDPQIGFAFENPTILDSIKEFTCMSNYTPNQPSKIEYDSSEPESMVLHQGDLTVMPDEIVRLGCEIQYKTEVDGKFLNIFWFEDIYNLILLANHTENATSNSKTNPCSRKSSITLRGFEANRIYRFYCVRVSEQRIYSRSVNINCTSTPSLSLDYIANYPVSPDKVVYGSNISYNISIFTVPRWEIVPKIIRNGDSSTNDKNFQLQRIASRNNQSFVYNLTIKNINFEDEVIIEVKSSVSAASKTIRPVIKNPIGQLAFVVNNTSDHIQWRAEDFKSQVNIYSYGIYQNEPYRVVCTVRHRLDIEQPLNVFIQQIPCSVDNCLSDIIDSTCRSTTGQRLATSPANRTRDYQTQFVSSDSQTLNDPSMGYQYLCCYEKDGSIVLAKALTALAHNREMFTVREPEYSLVVGMNLTYGCEVHELIYGDLQMIYNDGFVTYERYRFDTEWHVVGTNQPQTIDVDWSSKTSDNTGDTLVQVTTRPFAENGTHGYLQCKAESKRPEKIANGIHTYTINVDDRFPLHFTRNLSSIIRFNQKASDNVTLNCSYGGRPKAKVTWLKDTLPLIIDNKKFQLQDNNASIQIINTQKLDSGYYTCELVNGHDANLTRGFHLHVKGPDFSVRYPRLTAVLIVITSCLIQILLLVLIIIVRRIQVRRTDHKLQFQYSRARSISNFSDKTPDSNSNTNND